MLSLTFMQETVKWEHSSHDHIQGLEYATGPPQFLFLERSIMYKIEYSQEVAFPWNFLGTNRSFTEESVQT